MSVVLRQTGFVGISGGVADPAPLTEVVDICSLHIKVAQSWAYVRGDSATDTGVLVGGRTAATSAAVPQ